jgi:(p)ppGpp synthase/HD superfamily hydrolase
MITAKVFEDAIYFAVKKHRGQVRKGDGRPYILHPISVMTRVQEVKKSKNIFLLGAASILHDTKEDCGVSLKKIARKFGYQVAAIVEELSLDKEKYLTIGKTEYLCQELYKMSSYALTIKLCDRLDNVSDMESMSPEFQQRYFKETMAILDRIKTRKLSKTHHHLIAKIKLVLSKYGDVPYEEKQATK